MAVKPIPEGYHSVTPALTCRDAAQAIEFYKKAFGAREVMRMPSPDGKIMHAELKIGDSTLFLGDEFPGMSVAPSASSLPSSYLFLYVPDADSVFNSALAAGARAEMPVQDMFWGDRYGKLKDPFGHHWGVATHKEDVAPEEMERRSAAFFAKAAGQS
ncbi:MAG: VOC family protein [Candidatus Acidiferrales bacterium]